MRHEFAEEHDLSLVLIVPAIHEAIGAAIELKSVIAGRFGNNL